MGRNPQDRATKGSMKWLQLAVNDHSELLGSQVAPRLRPHPSIIEWLSPIECDDYAEYSDQKFIDRLGLKLKSHPLKSFWPSRGPHWDALAKTDKSQVLLVEAKARVRELKESGSGASAEKSVARIDCSLKETQKFLGVDTTVDWANSPYYQYANRLAHLYLLSEKNCTDAYLLMIFFLNDKDMGGPDSIGQWEAAIRTHHKGMCLRKDHRMSDRVINLFLDVRVLGE